MWNVKFGHAYDENDERFTSVPKIRHTTTYERRNFQRRCRYAFIDNDRTRIKRFPINSVYLLSLSVR